MSIHGISRRAAKARIRRSNLTPEERARESYSRSLRRGNLSQEARQIVRENDNLAHQISRGNFTQEQRLEIRNRNAAAIRQCRTQNPHSKKYLALMPVGPDDIPLENIGYVKDCPHCSASRSKHEAPGSCWDNGTIPSSEFFNPGPQIVGLFRGDSEIACLFRDLLRFCNSRFSLSSFACNEESRAVTGSSMSIYGLSYQVVPSMNVFQGTEPNFGQLYLYDHEFQLRAS
ncbi:MAG: hypothetical protein MHMPM18_002853 [Marteilia pararefringens]